MVNGWLRYREYLVLVECYVKTLCILHYIISVYYLQKINYHVLFVIFIMIIFLFLSQYLYRSIVLLLVFLLLLFVLSDLCERSHKIPQTIW